MGDPVAVLREQTVPALRGSGGDGHADAIEAVLAELAELRAGLMIPGLQACVTCGFELQKMVMRAADGAVGVQVGAPLEECPNGCGVLVGVTYERGWREMVRVAEEHAKGRAEAEAEARRWYQADGSFVEMDPEEVVARRKQAAVDLEDLGFKRERAEALLRGLLKAACSEVCGICADGTYPARPGKFRPDGWWHDVGEVQIRCAGWRLRELARDGKPGVSQPCDQCDPSFGCFDRGEPCRKVPAP
jgi:hypothetical protein